MSKIYKSIDELVGRTPLMELSNFQRHHALNANILAKIEFMNPAGSIKDRVAKNMIDDAEAKGLLSKNSTIIEPTSGNTGIGIAAMATSKGYKAIIVMPDNMSEERKKLVSAYGAKLVLTDSSEGMQGSVKKAEEIHRNTPNSIIAGQFTNPANPETHRKYTAPEIWEDTDGKVDIFISGIGTGGTMTGIGEYLKSKNPDVQVIAFEPAGSPLLSQGKAGKHGLQGIGANFIPETLNTDIYDEIITVSDDDAYETAREIGTEEGLLVGISSGAAAYAGKIIAQRKENAGKNIVVIFPDSGERYLSTSLF